MVASPAQPRLHAVTYKGWDGLRLERGPLALVLVPQVGGRIMSMQWRGQDLAFVNRDWQGRVLDVAQFTDFRDVKRRLGFVLWGGEKTWLAPQDRWTDEVPFIDLDSGVYALSTDEDTVSVIMASPICRETGVQIERTISLSESIGHWTVQHTLRNHSDRPVSWAPWSVAMLRRPATVFLPVDGTSAFPRGLRTFNNEGVSHKVRERVVAFSDGVAAINCRDPIHFKYGTDAAVGSALAVMETGPSRGVGLLKTVSTDHPGPYADGCVAEVFNSDAHPYFELEVHGPVTTLASGESFSLDENLALFDLDPGIDNRVAARFLFDR